MSEIATTAAGPVATTDAGSLLNIIASAVQNPAVDVAKMSALLDMQERVLARQAEAAFNRSLFAVSATIPRVPRNGVISLGAGKGQIPFAKWEDVDKALRPLMQQHGFALSFTMRQRQGEGGGGIVVATLLHADGHTREAEMPLPLDSGPGRNNLQAMGSTLSYGKRYLAEMLFNIVREGADDDGQAGGTRYITEAQKDKLVDLQAEVNADTTAFLRFMAVRSLDEIEAKDFTAAVNALMKKRAAVKGGAA